jgi:hypothetical protein
MQYCENGCDPGMEAVKFGAVVPDAFTSPDFVAFCRDPDQLLALNITEC